MIVDELWKIWSGLDDLLKCKARTFAQFDLQELNIGFGTTKGIAGSKKLVEMVPENIEHLFNECGRKLTNSIHSDFDQKYYDAPEFDDDPLAARLALYLMISREETLPRIEEVCGKKVSEWLLQFKAQINALPEAKRKRYDRIRAQSRKAEEDVLRLPEDSLEGIKALGDSPWRRHLFCDEEGKFFAKFNTWETPVLEEELENPDVLFWLRNVPRKPWALCVPYKFENEDRPCYPDFLFVRKEGDKLVCDILDPHLHKLEDAVEKAKGLAKFAEDHGYNSSFGRIELVAKINGQRRTIDLQNDDVRENVKKIDSKSALELLYKMP